MSLAELTSDERAALADALAAEHAAVYGYGVVAAYASPQRVDAVAQAGDAHRDRRDATTDLLLDQGADAPSGEAAYAVPLPVTDGEGAARLAVLLEDGTAAAWRAVLERSDPGELRRTALAALTDCAVRATGWRLALAEAPLVLALPGQG